MTTHERRQSLSELLRKQPGLRVPELARALGISEGTVRNDLNALEQQGRLTRVHGGAVLNEQPQFPSSSFNIRYHNEAAAKMKISQQAALLVNDGDSVFLDASTTIYYLARQLAGRQRLRVVTNGVDVARLMAENPTNMVILLGGTVGSDGSSVTGLLSEQALEELRMQKAFVSCSGFSVERGMTDVHLAGAHLKRKAIASAQQVFALVGSNKLGKEDLTSFAGVDRINHLFTDDGLSEEWRARLTKAGIPFTVCAEASPILP
ncbi:MAG TPA: DeoR/GlpR family DNA-binding transcription regulator [Anaerolineales bacterium]|nr:DeoR/GlpR family DNA-binding transcription regulator [Anaerolineales bacterium]HLO31748.1 DeoR/GlpR family DNA-binding transcription regulator [Anaerolineales bacterium]